jgi:hypothetical protein
MSSRLYATPTMGVAVDALEVLEERGGEWVRSFLGVRICGGLKPLNLGNPLFCASFIYIQSVRARK